MKIAVKAAKVRHAFRTEADRLRREPVAPVLAAQKVEHAKMLETAARECNDEKLALFYDALMKLPDTPPHTNA